MSNENDAHKPWVDVELERQWIEWEAEQRELRRRENEQQQQEDSDE